MNKLENLNCIIKSFSKAVIAFSGGVDSTYLAFQASQVLGKENVLLVTATSSTYPEYELKESRDIARFLGIEQQIIVSEELDIAGFSENPPDRCYYCKHELFSKIAQIAQDKKYDAVFDGSNLDDLSDYRPGRRALGELCVRSPLLEAKLTKDEIRQISAENNLPTAKKPSYACLASRFPYGEKITKDKLDRVCKTELKLRELGFSGFRVRSHDTLARLEFSPSEIDRAWTNRSPITKACKEAGFVFVAIDTEGYRTGAMNETLGDKSAT